MPTTFLNQPLFNQTESSYFDVALLGICFDGGCAETGVNEAPDALRQASQTYANSDGTTQPITSYSPDDGFLLKGITIADAGNLHCSRTLEAANSQVEAFLNPVIGKCQLSLCHYTCPFNAILSI